MYEFLGIAQNVKPGSKIEGDRLSAMRRLNPTMTAPLLALLLAGCCAPRQPSREPMTGHDKKKLPPAPALKPAPAAPDGLETFEARLDIERLAGSKRFQGCHLTLDDGEVLLLSYRPRPEYFKFVDKRVKVQGARYRPDPEAQQIMAEHFTVHSITLAAGEQPHEPEPTTLPRPPLARTRAEAEARRGRWVQLVGTLRAGARRPNDSWRDAEVELPDGARVKVSVYSLSFDQTWRPLVGQQVTVMGALGAKGELAISGRNAVCKGVVDGCGMVSPRPRKPTPKGQ